MEPVSRYLQLSGFTCVFPTVSVKHVSHVEAVESFTVATVSASPSFQLHWQCREFSLELEVQLFSSCEPGGKFYHATALVMTDKMKCT